MSENNTPSILPALYQETKNIVNTSNVKLYDWAAGLEMEATYILHPLDSKISWKKGLEQFYMLDISKIIKYINTKYSGDEEVYPTIEEAEVSGRKCAGVSVIDPDPRHSMLEIATPTPYSQLEEENASKTIDSNDLMYFVFKLQEIQRKAIRDLQQFYEKEDLWKDTTMFHSIIPYPYAMSNRVKNADIVLDGKKNTKKKTNYTGSYHFTLTLPFYTLEYDKKSYYEPYKRYINQYQWIEPLIIAMYSTTDMRGIGSEKKYSRASYRILMSGWGNPGGSDVRKFEDGLTRKVNIPLYWREGLDFPGKKKLEKYCANPKLKYNDEYVDPDRDLYDMGGDFRTPSGDHGQNWDVRDRLQGNFYGIEMRILDYFPPRHMASLLRFIVFLTENARHMENTMYVYEDKDWIQTMHNAFREGWRAEVPKEYVSKLSKVLGIQFVKKKYMVKTFWKILLDKLYKKNHKGFYVDEMLPQMISGEKEEYNFHQKKQPKLVYKNPNRESWDFGFLLQLNNTKIQKMILKTCMKIPNNKKLSLEKITKIYTKNTTKSWKHNMIDILYFFEKRDGLSIQPNKYGSIDTISISTKQKKNIQNVIENYIGSIVELWPELIEYSKKK